MLRTKWRFTLSELVKLYRTASGAVVEHQERHYALPDLKWDEVLPRANLETHLLESVSRTEAVPSMVIADAEPLLPPIGNQEVWAAGVTYLRSRAARMEESRSSGGGGFYDRVYNAERPELFFKATASRVVGHRGKVAIRSDSSWSVPEPELTLLISCTGQITGYTIGNDMSSRDIEGENPLYLPQAKVYQRCCAIGPGILVTKQPLPPTTSIDITIQRNNEAVFSGRTTIGNMKRELTVLVKYLYRDNVFPAGCFLLTGTGIVPPDSFTLQLNDEISISIDGIGTLVNLVG